ncbi:MAG: class A beta-lactamase-related serine hydrolase [Caldilineaceae bacterium]|nr:class A beta-lactamase-related serine hydrolase [Caldilineaceae bacterium]
MTNALLWSQLQDRVRNGLADLPGVAGFCLQDLATRDTMGWHEQEVFPVASTIKIPILVTLLDRAEKGELDLQERIALTPEVLVPGSGVLTYLEGPLDLSVLDIAQLMIMVSDNTATNLCIDWAGMDATNALMGSLGLSQTRIRRKMQDHESVARNEENVSTPADAVGLMRALHEGRPSSAVAEQALAILKKPNRGPIERAMEAGVAVSNKPGGMERVRCDAGIVWLQRHPYALALMSKFGMENPYRQENRLVAAVQLIHEYMVAIDRSSALGQGIPASLLDG